jgi:transcriptional regulator of aromatic amino acid metabolism
MIIDTEAKYARCAMAHWMSDEELARLLPDDDDLQRRVRDKRQAGRIGAVVAIAAVALLAAITPVVLQDEPRPVVVGVSK